MDWLQELENLVSLLSSVTTWGEEEALTTRGEEEALTTQGGEEKLTTQGGEENLTTQGGEENLTTQGGEENLTTQGEEEEQRNQEDVMDHTSLTTVDGYRSTDLQRSQNDEKPQKPHFETKNLGGAQLPSEAIHTPADFFQSKLYLGLEDETRETVTELMSLCAELGVHCTTAGSGSLRMFVRRYVSVLNVGRMRSLLGTEEWEMRSVCWREVAMKSTGMCVGEEGWEEGDWRGYVYYISNSRTANLGLLAPFDNERRFDGDKS